MRLLEYQGLRGPQHSAPQHSPLPTQGVALQTQDAAQGSPRCLQTSVLCLPACLPPGCARRALGRQARSAPPGTNAKGTGVAASPVFTYPAAPEPRPGQGLLGSAGPSRPPRAPSLPGWWWWWGPTEKKRAEAPELRGARGGRSARTLRPPRPESWRRGAPERREPASPAPRRATLTASPWVRPPAASVLLSRAPPPPPPPPRSLALRRGLRSLRRRLRPGAPPAASAPGVASATRVRGSAVERVRGRRLRRDDRGAAGGRARRSLGRRGGRSSRPRHWATAPPGPHVPLRRRDCGGRAEHGRLGTRSSAA